LVHSSKSGKIGHFNSVCTERGTKSQERSENSVGVLRAGSDEDVEVTGAAHDSMDGEGMGADDHEVDIARLQRANQIDEVIVESGPLNHGRPAHCV
jgi:hypothetical protein